MEKLYYKIELRMGEWYLETEEKKIKKINLEDIVVKTFYYSDGYLILEDGIITGFLSNDLITGNITENEIFIEILEDEEECIQYSSFANEFDCIEFPGKYLLIRQDTEKDPEVKNQFAIINFSEKIKNVSKQKEIEAELKCVKKIYSIP